MVRVTLAYSDTFLLSQGCHCKRGRLYLVVIPYGKPHMVNIMLLVCDNMQGFFSEICFDDYPHFVDKTKV